MARVDSKTMENLGRSPLRDVYKSNPRLENATDVVDETDHGQDGVDQSLDDVGQDQDEIGQGQDEVSQGQDEPDRGRGHRSRAGRGHLGKPNKSKLTFDAHTETHNSCSSWLKAISIGLVLAWLAVWIFTVARPMSEEERGTVNHAFHPYSTSPEEYRTSIERLKVAFPTQSLRTWKAIKGRGARHLRELTPRQPAVFLLSARPPAHATLSCLAYSLAKTFLNHSSNHSFARVRGQDIWEKSQGSGDEAKNLLDTVMRHKLEQQVKRNEKLPPVFVVENLERFPAPSPFLFFAYCDNTEAIDPRAVFIFTLHLPSSVSEPSSEERMPENRALDYLADDLWQQQQHSAYDVGTVTALVTRVSEVTILVKEEPLVAHSSLCSLPLDVD